MCNNQLNFQNIVNQQMYFLNITAREDIKHLALAKATCGYLIS